MNPLFVVPLLASTPAATLWPAQVDGHRRAATLLLWEAVFVIIALVAGTYFARLAKPSLDGLWGGRGALLATGYLYVSGRGGVLIRSVLELPTLQMRRDEDRTAGAIEIARGPRSRAREPAPPRPRPPLRSPVDERELIARVRTGDGAAERVLYDAHVDRVYRLAYRLAGDDELAREFTQDTFVRAFERLGSFRGEAKLSTWLHAIATSVVLNGLRKVKRLRRETDLEDAGGGAAGPRAAGAGFKKRRGGRPRQSPGGERPRVLE